MRILITSGGTEEPIDGVRSITNFSSGTTGAALADYFSSQGDSVTLLHGKKANLPQLESINLRSFSSFKDLKEKLEVLSQQERYDAVIHAAAVSDFSIDRLEDEEGNILDGEGKISSDKGLVIKMKKNPKLLDQLQDQISHAIIVGFKLTNSPLKDPRTKAIEKILSRNCVDFLVHNDLSEIKGEKHLSQIYCGDGKMVANCDTKLQMAQALYKLLGDAK